MLSSALFKELIKLLQIPISNENNMYGKNINKIS